MKVERAGVVLSTMFKLKQYPFDVQKLPIKVASSKYMLDEVVLEPDDDKSKSGVGKGIFSGTQYELGSWKLYAFAETDGALKKSRGVLEVKVDRLFDKYKESHLMPK